MKPSKISTLTTSAMLLLSVGLLSGCGDEAEDAVNQSKEITLEPVQSVETNIESAVDDGIESVSDMYDSMADSASDTYDSISDSASDTYDSMSDSVSDAYDSMSDAAHDAIDAGEQEISEAADSLLSMAEEGVADVQEFGAELQSGAAEEVDELVALVDDAGSDLNAMAESGVESLVDDAADVVATTPDIIRGVQQALTGAGFNPGPADGLMGPRTISALESFQAQNGLAVGQIDKGTLRALDVNF